MRLRHSQLVAGLLLQDASCESFAVVISSSKAAGQVDIQEDRPVHVVHGRARPSRSAFT